MSCNTIRIAVISSVLFFQLIFLSFAATASKTETPSTDSASLPKANSLPTVDGQAGQDKALRKVETYDELLVAIRKTRQEAETRVERAVEQEKVREAWETGKLIDEHVLQHKERAEYDKQVISRLAKDLGSSVTELSYMLQFAQAYPILPHAEELSWSDYRELLGVNVPADREALATRAGKEKWSRDRLREEIKLKKAGTPSPEEKPSKKLDAVAGDPGVYRIIRAKAGPFAGELAIDVGFSNYKRLDDVTTDTSLFEEGGMAEFSGSGPDGEVAIFTAAEAKNMGVRLYYYNAYIYKVLDGDTVTAVVDLGFGFATSQALRLRGIDAPEIKTVEGGEAKKALEKLLGITEGKSGVQVLIRTVKSDKYDRYLADLWAEGVYVNQELIGQGHAVRVHD